MIETHVAPQMVARLAEFAGLRHGDRRAVRVKRVMCGRSKPMTRSLLR